MTHDLTFVALERRDEVRRRILVVERFIAAPGRRAAEAAAAELGLRPAQFYNLVRAWRLKPEPEAMMGRHAPRNTSPRIAKSVLDLIDEVIAADGRAAAGAVIDAVAAAAAKKGISLPNSSTVARYVRRKRPTLLTNEQRSRLDLIVDHTVIDLAVDFGDGCARRPLATLVIDVASETPVGLAISNGTPASAHTATAMLDALRRGIQYTSTSSGKPRVGIVAMAEAECGTVIEALRLVGLEATYVLTHAHGGGLVAESVLGREHAGLRLKQRLIWHRGSRRSATVKSGAKALTPADAEELIRGRLLSGQPTMAFAHLHGNCRGRLTKALTEIAQAG
ncbi:MAG: hypothetical protein K2W81_00395 [Sphingomonas sp.]|uniref:hypothetical protein n=1 Tax=Sphingomonas sp. TaxID=28214 RepID=UPI0025E8EE88|nr:hypothetical protein [Sphingomonas sp.]MBY0282400.1 hypothetical protein [Sphingomonas sp.]